MIHYITPISECKLLLHHLGRRQQQPSPPHTLGLSHWTQGAHGDVLVSASFGLYRVLQRCYRDIVMFQQTMSHYSLPRYHTPFD